MFISRLRFSGTTVVADLWRIPGCGQHLCIASVLFDTAVAQASVWDALFGSAAAHQSMIYRAHRERMPVKHLGFRPWENYSDVVQDRYDASVCT